jgi:hypothetical protein
MRRPHITIAGSAGVSPAPSYMKQARRLRSQLSYFNTSFVVCVISYGVVPTFPRIVTLTS